MSDLDQLLRQVQNRSGLAWNDETYNLALAAGLTGADRATYIAALIDNAKLGDTHAILTLGHLGAREALPVLALAARGSQPWADTARRALTLLGHGADVVDLIAHDAVHAAAKMVRVAAVMDLGKIGGEVALRALQQALADPESAVRMLAWRGLVEALDLDRWLRNPAGEHEKTTLLELLDDFLACDLPSLIRIGVTEMRAVTDRLIAGADPAAIGLTWIGDPAPDVTRQIMAAIVDPDAAYPVAGIAQLTGVPRRWAESSLVMRLDQATPDLRVPEALAKLGAKWTLPTLEEVARGAEPDLRDKLFRAIAALRT